MSFKHFCYKSVFGYSDLTVVASEHPEVFYLLSNLQDDLFNYWTSTLFGILVNQDGSENMLSPVVVFIHMVVSLYLTSLFTIFVFTWFGNPSSEENSLDHDYTINGLLVESEEEIGSLDDMLVGGIIFFYIFG
jgi:hypothetical protein